VGDVRLNKASGDRYYGPILTIAVGSTIKHRSAFFLVG
jgi:hypothetical protein